MSIILVTGANGQLGQELRVVSNSNQHHHWIFAGRQELDVTDAAAISDYVDHHKPEYIINCAAYTNVEKAEEDRDACMLGNAASPGYLAAAAHQYGATLFHISTDYVFDGKGKAPYTESSPTAPLSVYGQSKLDGEIAVSAASPAHFILRTSWLYSTFGNNFYKTMIRLAKERAALSVVSDQFASPTYARLLAEDLVKMIDILASGESIPFGTYHYTQTGTASWFDFAQAIVDKHHLNVPVSPVNSDAFPQKAKRPAYSKMDTSLFLKNTGLSLLSWQEGLEYCIQNENV
ncbi:MAG: dTDP-4-dehydrorhamnose reductase [Flavobacteriales bacterium]